MLNAPELLDPPASAVYIESRHRVACKASTLTKRAVGPRSRGVHRQLRRVGLGATKAGGTPSELVSERRHDDDMGDMETASLDAGQCRPRPDPQDAGGDA